MNVRVASPSYLREGWLSKKLARIGGYTVLIVTTFILILPIFFLLISSLKLDNEYMTWPIRVFPKVFQWSNYVKVFTLTNFEVIALRTATLGVVYAIIVTFTSAMAGYGFARYLVPGNSKLFFFVISMLIVPGIVLLIPQFILFARLKLTNTYWPWILGALGGNAGFIFMFRQFFLNFPRELEEAAEVDGCGPFRIFWQIFIPNAKPVIATVMIFAFSGVWGDYLMPLIYLSGDKLLMGVAMATAFVNPKGVEYKTISMAANVLFILPLIVMFFLAQKQILKGVVTSGLKG